MDVGPISVLLVEDDEDEVFLIGEALRDAGATDITLDHAGTLQTALNKLDNGAYDAVLLDLSLPDSSGVEGVAPVASAAGKALVIVCTGLNDEIVGQDAIRNGAQDYLVKNPRLYGAVPRILRYGVERNRLIHSANEKVEQARKYTELLLTKVIAIANSGLGITDSKGAFSLVNPALAQLVDCSTTELVGTTWTDLLVEPDRAVELARYEQSFSRSKTYDRDRLTLQRKDGGAIEVPLRSVLVEFDDNRICRVLSFGSPAGSNFSSETTPPAPEMVNQLKIGVSGDGASFATSRLQIIGLQALKAELGDRWDSVSERVISVAENIIARHLSPSESFTCNQDGDFIICLNQLDEQAARSKAQVISQDIRNKILKGGDNGELAGFDLHPAILSALAEIKAETHTLEVMPEEVAGALDISALITKKIEEAATRARDKTNSMLAQIQKSCRSYVREAHRRGGKGASLMIHDLDPDTLQWVAQLENTTNDCVETNTEIDCLALGKAAEYIYKFSNAKVPLIAVGVHFSTITEPALFAKYANICGSLDGQAIQSLVLKITGVPRNIGEHDLAAAGKALAPYSRLQMIELKPPDVGRLNLDQAAVRLVAIDYACMLDSYVRDKSACRDVVKQVQRAGARMIVDKVTSQDSSFLFNELGVDFIAYERLTALNT